MKKLVEFGPVSLTAIGFPDVTKLKGEMLKEIFRLRKAGIIRVIGLLAISKDKAGKITVEQITDLSDEERTKLRAGVEALIGLGAAGEEGMKKGYETAIQSPAEFGLTQEQARQIADNMPNGTAAGIMLVEHLWAKKIKELAFEKDGVLIANSFITPQTLVTLGAELAEGAKIAEQIQYQ